MLRKPDQNRARFKTWTRRHEQAKNPGNTRRTEVMGAPFVDQAMSNLDGFSRVNRDKAVNIERIKVSISVTMIPIRPKT
jgi:hypothetical protein